MDASPGVGGAAGVGGDGWVLPASLGGPVPNGDVYRAIREDVTALVSAHPEAVADLAVPACPAWTVKDVVAHLTGVAADAMAGNLAGAATDPWTEAQVAARRDRSLAEVVEEWSMRGPLVEEAFTALGPELDARALLDAWTHQHDIRAALGLAPAPDPVGRWHTAQTLVELVRGRVAAARVPPVRVVLDGSARLEGGRHLTVTTTAHEWARGLLGRRSRRQVLAWSWTGLDPAGFVDELLVFRWSSTDQRG